MIRVRIAAAFILLVMLPLGGLSSPGEIVIGRKADEIERYAAKELQRYLYQITGEWLEIRTTAGSSPSVPSFLIGTPRTNPLLKNLVARGYIRISASDPGPQGYLLKKITADGRTLIAIAGGDAVGSLYGVYGLLADHFGVGFFLGGDILPEARTRLLWPDVDERKSPEVMVRGFLPWTNFPQSATVYSWDDWRFIIDQAAKMRLNFIHIHNYNGELGHNEMYHNFTYRGFTSRVWMPTARTGHRWACPGWDVNRYLFGASDLFDDYDFGSDCALHNESLNNEEVFRKSASLFRRVISYAHTRGVRIGLGLDIDLIPPEYKARPGDPEIIAARVDQLADDYPDLDYLLCFQSENVGKDTAFYKIWRDIFDGFYYLAKQRMPRTRLAVSGWGLDPVSVRTLPKDVICAPIAAYSDTCESGAIYGEREYWGCPWLERDFNSSEYYYPYNMHLSNTIRAYRNRAPNMKGFYCLTWRLTDAVEPKMYYISRAPWETDGRSRISRDVYREYAGLAYGSGAAEEITRIIDQNEPFAADFGECQGTPPFSRDQGKYLLNISRFSFSTPAAPTIQAASGFFSQEGVSKAGCDEGGDCVGYINAGDWVGYHAVDFGGGSSWFRARVASATDGGVIILYLDSLSGQEMGRCTVPPTGGWQRWTDAETLVHRTSGRHDLFMRFELLREPATDEMKALDQLALIDRCIAGARAPEARYRLGLLRCRIAAARDHITLNRDFSAYRWEDLPGSAASWVRNFTHRVSDISSLGNIMSTQNRFIQENYLPKEAALRDGQAVRAPSGVIARGTAGGAVITWTDDGPGTAGFNIYRDGVKINPSLLPPATGSYRDEGNGRFRYAASSVSADGRESPQSVPSACESGSADTTSPFIAVISPPRSLRWGEPFCLKARILDDRAFEEIHADFLYRPPGSGEWLRVPMERRVKAVFTVRLAPLGITARGIEYMVEATDGRNRSQYPASAPGRPASVVVEGESRLTQPGVPPGLTVRAGLLSWKRAGGDVLWYRIYRGRDPGFVAGPATYLTYVHRSTQRYRDSGEDFQGVKLGGTYYYRVTAVSESGAESAPAPAVAVSY